MNNKEKIKYIKEIGQFYTLPHVAKKCFLLLIKEIKTLSVKYKNIDNFDFIEPSAGNGSFIKVINSIGYKIKGYDIEPKYKNIIKMNFLESKLNIDKTKTIIIGNPPFGKRSKLAIDFFNKSAEYTNIIAFILPNGFKKYSVQNKLNKDFELIKEIDLDKNSFFTEYNDKYDVNCVFQIWINKSINVNKKNLRIIEKPPITHDKFNMYQYNNTKQAVKILEKDFDFAVFSQGYGDYSTLIFDKKDLNKKKQWLLFKAQDIETLEKLKKIDFKSLSQNNTTIPGFRKGDIIKEYINLYGE